MTENWFELTIIAFIAVGICAAIWKGGQANPEATGALGKRLARVEATVGTITETVGTIGRQVEDLENRSAKVSDIKRLERQMTEQGSRLSDAARSIGDVRETVSAIRAAGDQRGQQLDRLYDFIVEKGMSK